MTRRALTVAKAALRETALPLLAALMVALGMVSVASADAIVQVRLASQSGAAVEGTVTLSPAGGTPLTCHTRGGTCTLNQVPGGRATVSALPDGSSQSSSPQTVMIPPSGTASLIVPVP